MKTEILRINTPDDIDAIKRVAEMLDKGALVAFPTETVYGIGCKVDRSSIEQLNLLKVRPPGKHYTLHVGNHDQISMFVSSMNLQARKLIQNGLPGPMTVVFELDQESLLRLKQNHSDETFKLLCPDGTLGIRYPDNPVACGILSQAKSPIVAPSANPAGQNPAVSAREVLNYFQGRIDCVVESQNFGCHYNKSSTVVKIGAQGTQILREGAVSADSIKKWTTVRILFVCTGNTCRSPMAAGFCRKHFCNTIGCQVDELPDFGYIINSAGVAAFEGTPASHNAIEVSREQQFDLSSHRSCQLTPQDVEQSDLIYTMSQSHRDNIIQLFPLASKKCFVLDGEHDISDPFGMDIEVYRQCFSQILNNIIKNLDNVL